MTTRFTAHQELQVRALFDLHDSDADNALNLNELAVLLQEIGNKITALPAVSALRQHTYTVQLNPVIDCTSSFSARKIPRPQTPSPCRQA